MARDKSDKRSQGRPSREFSFMSFLWRFLASLFLVLVSYNPTQYSYWARVGRAMNNEPSTLGPEHFVVGIVLMIGWVILLAATQRSLGVLGLLLGVMLLGGVVWLLVDIGWLNVATVSSATWVALVCIAMLLAVGLSWSHVWRRLTGQFEVDDGDN
jgi:hypothetical protein